MSCAHARVYVEIVHGTRWALLDETGDVVLDGTEERPQLLVLVWCQDCGWTWRCTELGLGSAPKWARDPARRAIDGWFKNPPSYQGTIRSGVIAAKKRR